MGATPLTHILVKPAGPDCNMACGYCFYTRKGALFSSTPRHRMRDTVLEEMLRQLMEQAGEQVSVTWQGGEPTLMGLDFFERAVAFQNRFGNRQVVGNGLQTNGLLVTDDWADFFSRYNFLVGLSLDGPAHVHDHYRKARGGAGTWERVSQSARRMLDKGVSVNALTVVNDHSVKFPEQIYQFHKGIGLPHMQFIPCVENDPARPGRLAPFSVPPEAYGAFLCTLFDLWLADFAGGLPTTSIRFFESLIFVYAGLPAPECTLGEKCGRYVVVEHNGDVFSCDFFVEPRWKLGNLLQGHLAAMLNARRQKDFGRRKNDLPAICRNCRWHAVCRGGCPKDRRQVPQAGRINHLCEGIDIFLSHADPHLRRLATEARQRQGIATGPQGAEAAPTAGGTQHTLPLRQRVKVQKVVARRVRGEGNDETLLNLWVATAMVVLIFQGSVAAQRHSAGSVRGTSDDLGASPRRRGAIAGLSTISTTAFANSGIRGNS